MKKNKKNQKNGWLDADKKRLLQIMSVPLVVFILIIVIKIADRPDKQADPSAATESAVVTTSEVAVAESDPSERPEPGEEPAATEPTTEPETEPEATDAFATDSFKKDSIPEIVELMKAYFQARAIADVETMNQLYGIEGMSTEEVEAERSRMRTNAKYVTDFQNVTTYVKDGVAADSWLVYSVADIKFRSVKTTAPMVMYCYVTKDAEGNYRIADKDAFSPQMLRYIEEANRTDEVRRLSADVSKRLKEALDSDADLKAVYGILQANSPVWGEEYQESIAEVQISFDEESAAAESTAAESTAAESAAQ